MEPKKIFILIPAYNAEKTIEKVFAKIPRDFLPKISKFLVINDGSTDVTLDKIKNLKSQHPNITVVDKQPNEGHARA